MNFKVSSLIFLLLFCVCDSLKLKFEPHNLLKEFKCIFELESFFRLLMRDREYLHILSKLLKTDSSPFSEHFLAYCQKFKAETFSAFLSTENNYGSQELADLSIIFSPECISASKISLESIEGDLIPMFGFFHTSPIYSNSFRPSQWSLDFFQAMVSSSIELPTNQWPDWSIWCGDSLLDSKFLSPEFWNGPDNY